MTRRMHTLFTVVSTSVVVVTVAWGVVIVGSPAAARLQRFDRQRLNDLRTISREIQSLCHDPDIKTGLKRELPKSLQDLADDARSRRIRLVDPETGKPYEYTVRNETTYELCATFSLELDSDVDVFWNHKEGRQCFTVDALDPP